jgi:putative SOS response-associated peptidase YedK
LKWGFPHWNNSSVIINARSETALEKSMFRKSLLERRCVIPSSGYYEWVAASGNKKKEKFLLRSPIESTLYMAGMINIFRDNNGSEYGAFVILTTAAEDTISHIHDRMPVLLLHDENELWLNDSNFMQHALLRSFPKLTYELA